MPGGAIAGMRIPRRTDRPGWIRAGLIVLSVAALLAADGLIRLPGEQDPQARRSRPKKLIKVATIAPEGSTWMKLMHELDERVRDETGGEVGFKFCRQHLFPKPL